MEPTLTMKLRGRPVTNAEASEAVRRLINSHFHNPDSARCQIPVSALDDDVVASDFVIEKQNAIASFLDTPEAIDILGFICFQLGPMAHVFRDAGHDIPTKAEAEQSWCLRWMLKHAAARGADWREGCTADLKAAREKAEAAQGAPRPVEVKE